MVQVRIDKTDRLEWAKLSSKKNSFLKSDLEADWADFDKNENADDEIDYKGVHPEGPDEEFEVINELDIEYDSDPEP